MKQRGVIAFFCIAIISVAYIVFSSANFERVPPSAELFLVKDGGNHALLSLFNPSNDLRLRAFDSGGLSSYSLRIARPNGEVLLSKDEIFVRRQEVLDLVLPRPPYMAANLKNGDEIIYTVTVRDWSNANFFRGNETTLKKRLVINTLKPSAKVIATSRDLVHGGSALVAFKIEDLPAYKAGGIYKAFVRSGKQEFIAYPYKNKRGETIYLCLLAWGLDTGFFEGEIHLLDEALNEGILKLPLEASASSLRKHIPSVNISFDSNSLASTMEWLDSVRLLPKEAMKDSPPSFESIQSEDNKKISSMLRRMDYKAPSVSLFAPLGALCGAVLPGGFGSEINLKYQKEGLGKLERLGVDIACKAGSSIKASNDAAIGFSGRMAAYGNVVLLNHALGLSTAYGYLEEADSNAGRMVERGEAFARSGSSGIALENRLHVMVLVQGRFVNPKEWMSSEWIEANINSVLRLSGF